MKMVLHCAFNSQTDFMASKLPKELTFENALLELEEITRKLEDGKESLEKSMDLYERGVLLKDFCEARLKEAEGKWTVLQKKPDGSVKEEAVDKSFYDETPENGPQQGNIF